MEEKPSYALMTNELPRGSGGNMQLMSVETTYISTHPVVIGC